jgi:hypothetical protein
VAASPRTTREALSTGSAPAGEALSIGSGPAGEALATLATAGGSGYTGRLRIGAT